MNSVTRPNVSRPRVLGLDILRMVAVVLVLGRHMNFDRSGLAAPLQFAFKAWKRGGWVGVDLFFVLSGFLVSGLLFGDYRKHGKLSVDRFYVRRGWKIYPPFLVLIGITALTDMFGGGLDRRRYAAELCWVQNYFEGRWSHTWSLAVEEHFYLLLPAFLASMVWLGRGRVNPFKPLVGVVALMAVALLSLRIHYSSTHEYSHFANMFPTHLRLDSLMFGTFISYIYHFHHDWFEGVLGPRRRWLIAGGVAALLPAFVFPLETSPFICTGGLTLFYLGSGAILAGVMLSEVPKNRVAVALGMLGFYSYSIYLWHIPVRNWSGTLLELLLGSTPTIWTAFPVYFVGSFLVGVIMARLVEVPALHLRDRWFPARGTSRPNGSSAQPAPPAPDAESASELLLKAGD